MSSVYMITPRTMNGLSITYPTGEYAALPCTVGGPSHRDVALVWAGGHEDRARVHCRVCTWTDRPIGDLRNAAALAVIAEEHHAAPLTAAGLATVPDTVLDTLGPNRAHLAPADPTLFLLRAMRIQVGHMVVMCPTCERDQGLALLWAAGHEDHALGLCPTECDPWDARVGRAGVLALQDRVPDLSPLGADGVALAAPLMGRLVPTP